MREDISRGITSLSVNLSERRPLTCAFHVEGHIKKKSITKYKLFEKALETFSSHQFFHETLTT